jgi:hypothetical protein
MILRVVASERGKAQTVVGDQSGVEGFSEKEEAVRGKVWESLPKRVRAP